MSAVAFFRLGARSGLLPALAFSVVLVGRAFWEKVLNVRHFVDEGLIAPEDVNLFRYADTAGEAWRHIVEYYAEYGED